VFSIVLSLQAITIARQSYMKRCKNVSFLWTSCKVALYEQFQYLRSTNGCSPALYFHPVESLS
jgi:hypothetical protein